MTGEQNEKDFPYAVKDPEAFAHNAARVVEYVGKAAAAYMKPKEEGKSSVEDLADSIGEVVKTLGQVGTYWLSQPERTAEAQQRLVAGYIDLWSASLMRMMGGASAPVVEPEQRDKRFRDPEWSNNQVFDFIKQLYLLTTRWAEELIQRAETLDPHTREKALFYVRQITNALSPSNFLVTNPELLRETLSSNGENLVKGMQMLAEDISSGGGELRIRQSDPKT